MGIFCVWRYYERNFIHSVGLFSDVQRTCCYQSSRPPEVAPEGDKEEACIEWRDSKNSKELDAETSGTKRRQCKQKSSAVQKWSWESAEQRNATKALAAMIACSNSSANFVENPTFEKFCERMRPEFIVPGRTKITSTMEELYHGMKNKVGLVLASAGWV